MRDINNSNNEIYLPSSSREALFYLNNAQKLAKIGFYEYDIETNKIVLISSGIPNIIEDSNLHLENLNDLMIYMRDTDAKLLQEILSDYINNDNNQPVNFEHILKVRDNKLKYVSHTLIKINTKGHFKLLGMLQNITNKYHNEREILRMAYYDTLTQLLNRSGFEKNLNLSIKLAENVHNIAILFIDLDNFKTINDTMGHDAGDELLQKITRKIQNLCNDFSKKYSDNDIILSNIVPSRFGGDEFVISVPYSENFEFIEDFTYHLLGEIRSPIFIKGRQLNISASIGISCYPNDGRNFIELLKKSDTAMYNSKIKNKNTFSIFNKDMGETAENRLTIESDLIDAIKNNEIDLYYQPKLNLNTAKISSYEVLIRWNHPGKGLIYPSEFINIAEETNIIFELTDYVINKCYDDYISYFKDKNKSLSINLSTKQFGTNILTCKLFSNKDVNPKHFEFEITENILIDDFDKAKEVLDIIKQKGFKCSIDDFGSGYSSFNYIKNLPIDTIKIDKTFLQNITDDKDAAIIKTIVFMAKELKLNVVAEGVETKEQLDYLLSIGCHEVQGFLISKAVNLQSIAEGSFTTDINRVIKYIKRFHKNQQIIKNHMQ